MVRSSVEIRPVRDEDLPGLIDLVLGYIDFYERPRPERRELEWLARRLLQSPSEGRQLVATDDTGPVGFATLYFTYSTLRASRVAILNDLYVLAAHRRRGVATRLFDACRSLAREEGCASMQWETHPDNTRARALYEKLGAEAEPWIVYGVET